MAINPMNKIKFLILIFVPILLSRGNSQDIEATPNVTVTIFLDENNNGERDNDEELVDGFSLEVLGFNGDMVPFTENPSGVFKGYIDARARVVVKGYSEELMEGNAGATGTSVFFAEPGNEYFVAVSSGLKFDASSQMVILPCYEGGPAEGSKGPALIEFNYMNDGVAAMHNGSAPNPSMLASIEEIGATWGVGLQQDANTVYTSAIVKRHVGLGPKGVGGLYQYNLTENALSSYDLQGINTLNNGILDFGSLKRKIVDREIEHDESDQYALTKKELVATYDMDAFDKVGKTGIGDIDVTADENTLWLVNLYKRSLVSVDVSEGQPNFNQVYEYPILDLPGIPEVNYMYRRNINAGPMKAPGAESFTDMYKVAWERNKYGEGGTPGYTGMKIANAMNEAEHTTEEQLYRSYYLGEEISYNVPITKNGSYTVRLHFVELDEKFNPDDNSEPEQRLFNVLAENNIKLENYNIIENAGGFATAVVAEFEVDVLDNELNLEFVGIGGSKAKVSGIQIIGNEVMNSGELRPWGLTFHEGRGYIGLISDASVSRNKDHLYGFVLSFDPDNISGGFTNELQFPLKYRRERVSHADLVSPQPNKTSVWEAWIEEWHETQIPLDDETVFASYPQPILSDIDFDSKGDMVIGLMDRWAHQVGYRNYPAIVGNQTYIVGYAAGDILKAMKKTGPVQTRDGENYDLEALNYDEPPTPYLNNDGPSYQGEFFYMDYYEASRAHHGELFTGGFGVMPETDEVVLTVFNPLVTNGRELFENEGVFSQGTHVYSTENGDKNRAYLFIDQYEFGKANGLGDIEFLKSLPGINIGNYVWCDGNGDGIQQPNENGIPGVELSLICVDEEEGNTLVATTTTNIYGEYIFLNVNPNKRYLITMDLNQDGLEGFRREVTQRNAGGIDGDLIDSDAKGDLIPGFGVIEVNSLELQYNYSFDFGLLGPEVQDVQRTVCLEPNQTRGVFDLCEIADSVDMSGGNNVYFYRSEEDAIQNLNRIDIEGCNYESLSDTLFARVSVPGDILCYSIATVELIVNDIETNIVINKQVCEDTPTDLTRLINLNQESTMVFTSPSYNESDMIADLENYIPDQLPVTLYFKASFNVNCDAFGELNLTAIPSFEIDMEENASICMGEQFFFSDLNISFPEGAGSIDDIYWETTGSGTFNSGPQFSNAQSYTPSQDDIDDGYIEFTLVASNECYLVERLVKLTIFNEEMIRIDCPETRTVDCTNDSIADLFNPLFPKPTAVVACDKFINPELNYVEIDKYDCPEEGDSIVGRIVRHWIFEYKVNVCDDDVINKVFDPECTRIIEAECSDTIYISTLPLDSLVCPDSMVMLECEEVDSLDANGNPHPYLTGVPRLDTIDLYPGLDSSFCSIYATYEDVQFIPNCGSTGMIKRIWTIHNRCGKEKIMCEQWIQIQDTKAPIIRKDFSFYHKYDGDTVIINTEKDECVGLFYPSIYTRDLCVGVHSVKAMVANYGAVELVRIDSNIYRALEPIRIPYGHEPVEVVYEASDLCWNMSELSHFVRVKDHTPPTVVVDDNVSISLTQKKSWLKAEELDEGSWDNCGDVMVLARRMDWETFCVELCTDEISEITTLEDLNKIDPLSVLDEGDVELYYRDMIRWLEEDYSCGDELVEGWRQGIRSYWAENCGPKDEHGNPLINVTNTFIGGGWSKKVPFGCEDVCQDVMVEILVMDQWCNWGKSWTTVRVEDKVEPKLLQRLEDVTLSCDAYNKYYKSVVDLAVEAGNSENDSAVYANLDNLLGGYNIAWENSNGEPVNMNGDLLPADFSVLNTICGDSLKEIKYQDTLHDGEIVWKTRSIEVSYLEDLPTDVKNGYLGVNCTATVVQDIWPDIDECGYGTIMRKFYVSIGCGNKNTTREYTQTINIEPTCPLRSSMFSWPEDTEICMPLTLNAQGNVNLPVSRIGKVDYTFPNDCRTIGIGHRDRVLEVLESDNMHKIVRTYTVKDWCSGESLEYDQVIVLVDTCDAGNEDAVTLAGTISNPNDQPILNVELNIMEQKDLMEKYGIANGNYFMQIPYQFDRVYLTKEDSYRKGVSLLDLIWIQRVLSNKSTFDNKYQEISADVNNNGILDLNDLLTVRNLYIGRIHEFSDVQPWKFIDKKSGKGYADIPVGKSLNENDWIGVKMGDVNFDSDHLIRSNNRSTGNTYPVTLEYTTNDNGDPIVKFIAGSEIRPEGVQMSLDFSDVGDYSIEGMGLQNDGMDIYRSSGEIKLIWLSKETAHKISEGDILFTATVKNLDQNEFLKLGSSLVPEIYGTDMVAKEISFNHRKSDRGWSHKIYPNPVNSNSILEIKAPGTQEVNITIRGIDGKLVRSWDSELSEGINRLDINFESYLRPGVYFYQILNGESMQTGRFEIIPE